MLFSELGLKKEILRAIEDKGYTVASPIQEKAIPIILKRHDVLASAQTGTGKTAGFTLPMLHLISDHEKGRKRTIKCLILTPTRELAAQIYENVNAYSKYLDIKATVIFGGVNANPQISTLRQGVDVLIATPGRLLDLYNQKIISLSNVDFFVLDEADRMLDMGFSKDINRILNIIPPKRQNLLFSATFSLEIKKLASGILVDPEIVEVSPEQTTAEKVNQYAYRVDKSKKHNLLIKLIKEGKWHQVLVFTRTKHGANKLSEKLVKADISSAAIHGNKTQNARTKALSDFKANNILVLVATDIAARGLDIPLLPWVVNYELPNVPEDYVHRIGRTGRAGASGDAISMVTGEEMAYLRDIEKLLQEKIPMEIVKDFEPTPEDIADEKLAKPKPGANNRNNSQPRTNTRPNSGHADRKPSENSGRKFWGKRRDN